MAKRRKPKYYAYQLGGTTGNWDIPKNDTPSVISQSTDTAAKDIYGNQYFKPDNNGDPTTNNPDIVPIGNRSFWSNFHTQGDLNPAIQNLNAGMQGVTSIAGMINDVKNNKYEKDQQLRAITPKYYENMEGYGLNANPVFTKYGGSTKYQVGGQPTMQDSLDLLNNTNALLKYYDKGIYRKAPAINMQLNGRSKKSIFDDIQEAVDSFGNTGSTTTDKGTEHPSKSVYRKDIDTNKFLQRERYNHIIDTRAPMGLYDKRITPTMEYSFLNTEKGSPLEGDAVNIYGYDPIAITPYSMLTPKQKIIRDTIYPKKSGQVGPESLPYPNLKLNPSNVKGIPDNTATPNVQASNYKPTDMSQKPTKFSATYRDENSPGKQNTIYFKSKDAWKNFMNQGAISGADTKETQDAASATGYRTMQVGGTMVSPLAPQQSYYNDNTVSGTNAFGSNDYAMDAKDKRMASGIDMIHNVISSGLVPNKTDFDKSLRNELDPRMYNYLYQFNQRSDLKGMTPEQRINSFYSIPATDPDIQSMKLNMKRYGYGPLEFDRNKPSASTTGATASAMKNGGKMNFKSNSAYKKMQTGGDIPETYGLDPEDKELANVNAEKGEAVENQDGSIDQIANDANTHEQGGVYLPDVHRVLENTSNIRKDKHSKALKMTAAQVKAATGAKVKGSMSHAEALVKANEYYEDQRHKIIKKVELTAKDRPELDKYSNTATSLNIDHFKALPTKEQLFDQLFNHQEMIKSATGIPTGGQETPEAKTGIHIKPENRGKFTAYKKRTGETTEEALHSKDPHVRQMANFARNARKWHHGQFGGDFLEDSIMQLGGYTGNKTGLKTPAGHSDAFPATKDYSFENYLSDLSGKGFKYEGITNPAEFQQALYDYQLKNNPDAIRKMWGEGMHQKGMAQAKSLGLVDDKGLFKKGVLDDPNNLQNLRDIYADGILGVRTMQLNKKPPRIWEDADVPEETTPEKVTPNWDTTITPPDIRQQPGSRFNEPLRWYDTASPVNAYISALEREPGKYNPAEANQLRYKLLDPTAALQQNQADFNAGVQGINDVATNNPGAAAANISNLAAQKYAANNQILGQYENQNAGIKNNEITYNTQVRDKNSLLDQQARETFENKVLQSKATQQEQKLTALDSLYKTIAENKALNRNGNLIMKFSRAFDQYGDYNGYKPMFSINPALGINNSAYETNSGKTGAAGGVQQLASGKSYYNRKTGKTLYFDGTKLVEKK